MLNFIIVVTAGIFIARHVFKSIQESQIVKELGISEDELRIFQSRLYDPLQWARSLLDEHIELGKDQLQKLGKYIRERMVTDADLAEGTKIVFRVGQAVAKANQCFGNDTGVRKRTGVLIKSAVDVEREINALSSWMQVHALYLQLWVALEEEAAMLQDLKVFQDDSKMLRDIILRRFPYVPYRLYLYAREVDQSASRVDAVAKRVKVEIEMRAPWYKDLLAEAETAVKDLRSMQHYIVSLEDYDKHLALLQQEQDRERLLDIQQQKLSEVQRSNRIKEDALYRIDRSAERTVSSLTDLRRDVRVLTDVMDRRLKQLEETVYSQQERLQIAARNPQLPALLPPPPPPASPLPITNDKGPD
mmetsp:Transcript_4847/g.8108  ORF Transcript_4847/g.8108 Transcript_4847/m.8108 type:complete len:360 (+) Transcript_4847:100-1179(+)